ncbi:MAG TPA: ferrochelatase [Gaiella sp.]|nr:ferrochelatase [Gaiella sp.]
MSGPAVILMAYGSPDRLADVPDYYADIRGGRPIAQEHLHDLVARYRALGIDDSDAPSPLNAITEETRAALERALGIPVFTGMRHWEPRIATAVDAALGQGHDTLVGLVLAPHWSTLSIARYETLFDDAVAGRAETRFVREWGSEPSFVDLLARRIRDVPGAGDSHVVFTAHSLPARILETGDTYHEALLETSRLVADRAAIRDWSFAFQSESPTGEPWLGPDILDHLVSLRDSGVGAVVACPVGFVSDHLEIRWDLDVEAAERARELGLGFARIEMPNEAPEMIQALAGIVRRDLAAVAS